MKKPYVIATLVIITLIAIYYFGFYKKKETTTEKSNFDGKTHCGCKDKAAGKVVFNQNTGTFRNTGVPCNVNANNGDAPKAGTVHINAWGGKACMASASNL